VNETTLRRIIREELAAHDLKRARVDLEREKARAARVREEGVDALERLTQTHERLDFK
jgi:hypothetical protein